MMETVQKTVFITGAARGIGKVISGILAARGHTVLIADILKDKLNETAEYFKSLNYRTGSFPLDITDREQVEDTLDRAEEEWGGIDVMINNAGTFSYIGPVWDADPDSWFKDIRTNLFGTFLCCRSIAKKFIEKKNGYIINMLGGGVQKKSPYNTSYACSKTALMRLTDSLAEEVAPYNVKVFGILPGTVLSDMTKFIMNDSGGKKWRPNFKTQFDEGRDTKPEETGALIGELLTGKADHLSGYCFLATLSLEKVLENSRLLLEEGMHSLNMSFLS